MTIVNLQKYVFIFLITTQFSKEEDLPLFLIQILSSFGFYSLGKIGKYP